MQDNVPCCFVRDSREPSPHLTKEDLLDVGFQDVRRGRDGQRDY